MNKWVETANGKKIKLMNKGKVIVITTTDVENIVPLFCQCCLRPMKTIDDSLAYRKNKICNKCDERWTNKPNIVWPTGPDKLSKEWEDYINTRNILEKPILELK